MWVIFIVSGMVIALVGLGIYLLAYWIGNKVSIATKRDNQRFEIESEAYQKIKENVKKENEE